MPSVTVAHNPSLTPETAMEIFRKHFKGRYEIHKSRAMINRQFAVRENGFVGVFVGLDQDGDSTGFSFHGDSQSVMANILGGVSVSQIRDLIGVITREKANIGIFLTLEPPTKPMVTEAALQGFYNSPLGKDYPRIQILTIEDVLNGERPSIPPWIAPIQAPPKTKKGEGTQTQMGMS